LPAYDDESAGEERDVNADDVRKPQDVVTNVRCHIAVEPPHLSDWTLHTTPQHADIPPAEGRKLS